MKVYTEGLSGYRVKQPHDQSPGDACVEGCVFEKGRGGLWVLPPLHVCISYQLLKLQNYPVGLRSLSNVCCFPPTARYLKRITKTNAKNDAVWYIKALQLCYLMPDNISHILTFSVVMTDISVLRRNQFGSLNRWERGKNRGANSIKLHTISGRGIQISWGIRECIPIAKRLCAGKDNRDF